jgi:anti-sigma regulatory factor (Ser/Thr protein kinase)
MVNLYIVYKNGDGEIEVLQLDVGFDLVRIDEKLDDGRAVELYSADQ